MSAIAGLSKSETASNPDPVAAGDPASDASVFVQLPTDGQRATGTGYAPGILDSAGTVTLGDVSGTMGRATVVGAVLALLHRYSQQAHVCVDVHLGHPGTGSGKGGLIRCSISGTDTALATITEARRQLSALASQTFGASQPGAPSASPDLQSPRPNVALVFLDPSPSVSAGAFDLAGYVTRAPAVYDLQLVFRGATGSRNGARLAVVYNARLFHPETVQRLVDSFVLLIAAVQTDVTSPLSRLPVLSAVDRRKVTVEWDSGRASYPLQPVHRAFEGWARSRPTALAAAFNDQLMTYAELDERSNRLAHHLIGCGVGRGVPVAVCVQPSFDVLVGLLAVFKAGGIYLPLDPTHPEAHLSTILEEAQPRLVLTQSKLRALTQPERFPQFHFDTDWVQVATAPATAPVPPFGRGAVTLDHAAYQLYTSGTTGKPKGVVATHANLAHYIHVAQQKYNFRADDVFCSLARYTFSISMFELLSPLCCGGALRLLERDDVLAPDRLARILETMTVVHAGPSLMGNLLRHLRTSPSAPRSFPGMRHASSGGDLVPPHLLEEMKQVFANAEIFVIYGCTEISCMGTTYPVSRQTKVTRSFVGKPFPDVAVRLLDGDMNLVPFGVVGEICFGGKGVVPGYVQRPELTAEKFVEVEGGRLYRTGDMGRLHADGNLEILGRRDFQVQVRGIRIELSGIENTIRELGLAFQCAVLVKKLDEYDIRLVAFVVKPRDDDASIVTFRRALAERLPDYMLPQNLVVLDALPLTANGKLDRKRLDELPWQQQGTTAASRTGPRDSVERNIAAAFASCLGVPEAGIGIDDNFFDLGGHSLLAVMLLEQLENKLGVTYPPDVLFEYATVRALATYSQGSFTSDPRPILLNDNKDGPTLFVLVGVHLYRQLAKRLEAHYSVRAVYAGRELVMFDSPHHAPSVDELARDYVHIIQRHQPEGPYRLVGMSFGGIVAYEVARQLRQAGQEVSFLGLLDAVLPERGLGRRLAQMKRLQGLPVSQWAHLASLRFHRLAKTLLDKDGSRAMFADYQKYGGEARLLPLEDQRQEAYRIATEDYVNRMTPFTGNVTLVVAAQRMKRVLMQSPCLGWSVVVPNLRVYNVDSDHLRLLEEPHVRDVAAIFLEGMGQTISLPAASPT